MVHLRDIVESLHHHSVVPLPLGKGGFTAPTWIVQKERRFLASLRNYKEVYSLPLEGKVPSGHEADEV